MADNRPSPDEARTFLRSNESVGNIDLLITDANGIVRGKRIRRDALGKVYEKGICLPGSIFGCDICGDTVETTGLGFDRGDSDDICLPVPDTLSLTGWQSGADAQVIMSMFEADGTPFFADPRQVLERVLARFRADGLNPMIAVELEFYLLDREAGAGGAPQPPMSPVTGERESSTQVYGMAELDAYSAFLDEVDRLCSMQNLPADTAVAEYAPGQYEINLHHVADAAAACDQAMLLKRIIKRAAERFGMDATFMAKPYADRSGSGTHIHVSMLDAGGGNVFEDASPAGSEALRYAVGGLLEAMPESMAILAPNANSFRRFQPGNFVPMTPCWGANNRTTAIRIPAGDPAARRIEHRVAGADANVYLVVAAVLAGMHHGMANEIEPPPPSEGDAAAEEGTLPNSWLHAIEALQRGAILPGYLGEDFLRVFAACRRQERLSYEASVSPLEIEWYLRTV
ncbi:MAG: glutamine synthetase family protein [Chromatiales bacterium]|nr:glutamine synthetase family protein [Chromatiales bacterium]